jgi:hypothetical protein
MRAYRYCPCSLFANLSCDFLISVSGVHVQGLRSERHDTVLSIRSDQFTLSSIPLCEHLRGGGASEDAWVDQAWKPYMGDMS